MARSGALDMPIVFVFMKYRLGGFGFLPSAEILRDDSANIELLDRCLALEWAADNIAAFEGESA